MSALLTLISTAKNPHTTLSFLTREDLLEWYTDFTSNLTEEQSKWTLQLLTQRFIKDTISAILPALNLNALLQSTDLYMSRISGADFTAEQYLFNSKEDTIEQQELLKKTQDLFETLTKTQSQKEEGQNLLAQIKATERVLSNLSKVIAAFILDEMDSPIYSSLGNTSFDKLPAHATDKQRFVDSCTASLDSRVKSLAQLRTEVSNQIETVLSGRINILLRVDSAIRMSVGFHNRDTVINGMGSRQKTTAHSRPLPDTSGFAIDQVGT